MSCAACSKTTDGAKLQQCGRCKQVSYCSKECQTSDWPTHKATCVRPNYILRSQLCPQAIAWRLRSPDCAIDNPRVERTISCPSSATFDQLHEALQRAFGWSTTHTYDFNILDPDFGPETGTGDDGLMDMMQRAMGKVDPNSPREYSLRVLDKEASVSMFVDKMHDKQRCHPRTPEKGSRSTKLFQIFDDAKWRNGTMVYTYDFGDRWEHLITVTGRADATRRFECIDGIGHGVAEDVVQDGWAPLKEAYRTARPNQEQREKRQWYEQQASNGDRAGLGGGREHVFDKAGVNAMLSVRTI